jgi:hypothetical protein
VSALSLGKLIPALELGSALNWSKEPALRGQQRSRPQPLQSASWLCVCVCVQAGTA